MSNTATNEHNAKMKAMFETTIAVIELNDEQSLMLSNLTDQIIRDIENNVSSKLFALANDGSESYKSNAREDMKKTFDAFTDGLSKDVKREVAVALMDVIRDTREYHATRIFNTQEDIRRSMKIMTTELYGELNV